MSSAVHRPVAAGVAVLGASAIALSTITPLPDVSTSAPHRPALYSAGVDLLASTDVRAVYEKLFQDIGANAATLIDNAAPGQLLAQFIQNQLHSVKTLADGLGETASGVTDALMTQVPQLVQAAVDALTAGRLSEAFDNLIKIPLAVVVPVADLVPALHDVVTKPLRNLVNVIDALTADPLATTLLLSGFIAPLISTPAAIVAAVQNVVDAFGTSPAAALEALLEAPATIVDGFLNGGYGPDLGALVSPGLPVKAGGLLSSAGLVFLPDGSFFVNTGGPIAAFQQLITKITDAITPVSATPAVTAAAVVSLPATAPTTVTLATGEAASAPSHSATEADAVPSPAAEPAGPAAPEDAVTPPAEVDQPTAADEVAVPESEPTEQDSTIDEDEDATTDDSSTGKGSSEQDSDTPDEHTGKADSAAGVTTSHKPRTPSRRDDSAPTADGAAKAGTQD